MMTFLAALIIGGQSVPATNAYRASGTDPVWSLTIADGRLTYESPGRATISLAAPAPKVDDGILNYETPGMSIDIMPLPCTDKTSGQRFADTVFLEYGGEGRSGCGGIALATDSLNGTSWLFAEIGGETVELTGDLLEDDKYAIDFYADGFVGYDGCNRISAGYSRDHGTLTVIPPWRHTTGRCSDSVMRREQRLFQILSSPVRLDFTDSKTLMMSGESGTIKLRRKR